MKNWYMLQHGWIWKHYAKWKPVTEDHILYDSIFMKCSEKTNLCRYRKQMSGCLGLVVGTRVECRWAHGNFGGNGNVLKLNCADGCTTLYIYQYHWIMYLEWMNFLVYKLYLICFFKGNENEFYKLKYYLYTVAGRINWWLK